MCSENLCFLCGFTSPSPVDSLLGSQGSTELNNSLVIYFITQKMFQFSQSQTLTILNELPSRDKFCLKTCEQCQVQIAAGLSLHQEVAKLQDEIRQAGRILSSRIQDGWREGGENSGNIVSRSIRSFLFKENPVKLENGVDSHLETDLEPFDDFENLSPPPNQTDSAAPSKIFTPEGDNFRCKLCSSVYTSLVGIRKHEKYHQMSSSLGNLYDCHICKFPATSQVNLKRHLKKVHHSEKEDLESYSCDRCSSVYSSLPGLKNHQEIHKQSDLLGNKFDCSKCNHPTTSKMKLSRHLAKVHQDKRLTNVSPAKTGSEGRYKCDRCPASFPFPSGLELHSKRHEKSDLLQNKFDCEVCGHPSLSEIKLTRHLVDVHHDVAAKERLEAWENAGESVKDRKSSLPDYIIKEKDGKFRCTKCDSTYATMPGVKQHEKKHTESDEIGNLYDCKICRHPSKSELILRRHMSIIHGVKPGKRLQISAGVNKIKDEAIPEISSEVPKISSEIPEDSEAPEGSPEARSPEGNQDSDQGKDDDWRPDEVEVKKKPGRKRKWVRIGPPNYDKWTIPELFRRGEGNVWHCNRCESAYTTVTGMKIHEDMHEESDQLGNAFDCELCRHPNGSDSKLRRHLSRVHGKKVRKGEFLEDLDENEAILVTPKEITAGDGGDKEKLEESVCNGMYHCSKCNVNYKSQRGYERHEEEHKISIEIGHKFDCSCGFPASSEQRLRNHKRLNHSEHLTCHLCQLKVDSEEQLKAHLRWHQPSNRGRVKKRKMRKYGQRVFKCDQCKAKFIQMEALTSHLQDHEKSGVLYTCKVCRKPCLSKEKLKQHRLEHKRKGVICHFCHKKFCNNTVLERHERCHKELDKLVDPVTGLYHCALCTFIGRSRRSLLNHRSSLHKQVQFEDSGVPHALCPQCGKSFYTAGKLRQHIKNIHENIYRYNCELCGKGFDNKVAFSNHKITHIDVTVRQRQHICDTCGASYSHKQSLASHISKFHTDPVDLPDAIAKNPRKFAKAEEHRCKYCEMVFPFRYMLVSHVPTVHPEVYKFPCDQCSRKYTSSSSLRLHKEIAHSGNTFTCEFCQRGFNHKHYAYQHYKVCPAKREQTTQSSSQN